MEGEACWQETRLAHECDEGCYALRRNDALWPYYCGRWPHAELNLRRRELPALGIANALLLAYALGGVSCWEATPQRASVAAPDTRR